MMTRRKLSLAVVVVALAAFASTPILGAVFIQPALEALEDAAVIGTSTPLLVSVDTDLVGGAGLLYARTESGDVLPLGMFALESTSFVINAPVPTNVSAGETLTYAYCCMGPKSKGLLVSTGASVLLKTDEGTEEPPAWR